MKLHAEDAIRVAAQDRFRCALSFETATLMLTQNPALIGAGP